jgi:alkylation response protein AidB-like acyl-CoA dehydrogenase
MILTWDQAPEEVYPQLKIVAPIQKLVSETLVQHVDEADENVFPQKNVDLLIQHGYLGLITPKEFGGLGLDALHATYAIEQISSVAPATGFLLLLHLLTCNRIYKAGTDYHRAKYLSRIAGNALAASAWSEKGVGADKAILHTKAFLEDGNWHLTGQKAFCTGAGQAGVYMVMTDTTLGKAFFLVEGDNPGLLLGPPMDSMGLQGTHSGSVGFQDALVADEERVGEPGRIGPIIAYDMRSGLHSGIVASGIALGTFRRLLATVRNNMAFEKYESVRVRVSSLAVQLSIIRSHVYALAEQASKPESVRPTIESATMSAKLFLSEAALQMTTDAIAIAGTAGYLRETGLERLHRDALGIVIAAPINGQVLGSIGESLRIKDTSSHLYKV